MRLALLLFVVALCGTASAGPWHVDTRVGCPPTGYTALSPESRLDRLPAGGKYAICQTALQATQPDGTDHLWTMTHGVFRLRNSQLIVDEDVEIHFEFPARPDWSDVSVSAIPETDGWGGVYLNGEPEEIQYHGHYPPFGNCGDLDKVLIVDVTNNENSVTFSDCRGQTTVKKLTVFDRDDNTPSVVIENSKHMVLSDVFVVVAPQVQRRRSVDEGRVTRGRSLSDAIDLIDSSISILDLYARADVGLRIQGESAITLCNPFIVASEKAIDFNGGESSDSRFVAVAGITNLNFPDDVFFTDNGASSFLAVLPACPAVLDNNYSPADWVAIYTKDVGW